MEGFKKYWKNFKNHSYLFFLGIATIYGCFYLFYSVYQPLNENLNEYADIFKYLSEVSILFFTVGIFSVSFKYMQFLGVFEKEFKKAIASDEFDKKLEKQLKQITFSEEFLLKQSNLPEIWETVTLCKYEKQFPELYPKMKKKINNLLFLNNNISYYYKNFQLNYSIKKVSNSIVEIEETASLTIVRPNIDEFVWDFGVIYDNTSSDSDEKAKLYYKVTNQRGIEFNESDINKSKINEVLSKKSISKTLSKHLEYHIDRKITLQQDLSVDREFSFGSDRIIDDISVNIKHCDEINVYFAPVDKNKMYHNGAFNEHNLSYINRDIFLPGEKFKIFMYFKNE